MFLTCSHMLPVRLRCAGAHRARNRFLRATCFPVKSVTSSCAWRKRAIRHFIVSQRSRHVHFMSEQAVSWLPLHHRWRWRVPYTLGLVTVPFCQPSCGCRMGQSTAFCFIFMAVDSRLGVARPMLNCVSNSHTLAGVPSCL